MTRARVIAVSKWAHHSWLMRGEPARSERAEADANAYLLARFPQLAGKQATEASPFLATLPRPACAKALRIAAALAHARSLRRLVSSGARAMFATSIAPHVLAAIQRDPRGDRDDPDVGAMLNVLDRGEMTAAGLALALHALGDPVERIWMELRLPRAVAERATRYRINGLSGQAVDELIRDACGLMGGLTGGEAC